MRAAIAVVLCTLITTAAVADPATAKKHNNAGMKAYSKGDHEGAKALFEKAIKEDPGFVKAHYNRASMAALLFEVDAMTEELSWLKGSTDPEAARALAKAKSDSDFSSVSLMDDARVVIGLPPLADLTMEQIALEYGGGWSGVDEGMMQGWLEVRFMPKGKVTGRDHSGEDGLWSSWSGTWKVNGRTIVIAVGKIKTVYELKDCGEWTGTAGARCLLREEGGAYLTRGAAR